MALLLEAGYDKPETIRRVSAGLKRMVQGNPSRVYAGSLEGQSCCSFCNLHKSDRMGGIDPETQTEVLLFHPRADRWDDHFVIDLDTGEIRPLTPSGRVTVVMLHLNSPLQLHARRHWIQLGFFR